MAAGNHQDRISTPGISPAAITVGGVNDQSPFDPSCDTPFGVVFVAGKPDVSAPAVDVTSTLAPYSRLDNPYREHLGQDYLRMAGTSMATPAVAGLVALLRQERPNLALAQLKAVLAESAFCIRG